MKRFLSMFLSFVLVAVCAVPAMAGEFTFSGLIRNKLYLGSNYERYDAGDVIPIKSSDGAAADAVNPSNLTARNFRINTDAPTATYFEERGRLKFEGKGDEVGVVAFYEIDLRFGDGQYSIARNSGGGLEGDTINMETKNLYVWFKPTTDALVNVGLQSWTDAYRGVLLGYSDISGIFGTAKFAPVDLRYGWGVIKHGPGLVTGASGSAANNPGNSLVGSEANKSADFYALEAHFVPTTDSRAGLNLYQFNDNAGVGVRGYPNSQVVGKSTTINTIGVDGSFKVADPITLSAFLFYQTGKADRGGTGGADLNIKGQSADVRADIAVGSGKGFIEAIYISGDDNPSDNDYKGIVTGSNYALAGSFFASTDMEILLPNTDDQNTSEALTYDSKNFGQGLVHIGAGYTLPLGKTSVKIGVGNSRFAKVVPVGTTGFNKKNQATEVNLKVNYNLKKGLDAGIVAAYAILGDAYDVGANSFQGTPAGLAAPDNLYKLVARLNYVF